MNAMTAIAAVPALGLPSGALAAITPDRGACWDAALVRYQAAERALNAALDRENKAEEAACSSCPGADNFLDKLGLRIGMKRDYVRNHLVGQLCDQQGIRGLILYPPEARIASEEKMAAIQMKADALTDEFMVFQERWLGTRNRFKVDELAEAANKLSPGWRKALDELLRIPAPDTAALLVKLELAIDYGDYDDQLRALDDAKRLLTVTH